MNGGPLGTHPSSPITKEGNYAGLEEDLRGHRARAIELLGKAVASPAGPRPRRVAASSGWSTRPGCSWRRPAAKTVGARLSMHPAIPKRPAHPRPRRVAEDRTRVECSTRSFSSSFRSGASERGGERLRSASPWGAYFFPMSGESSGGWVVAPTLPVRVVPRTKLSVAVRSSTPSGERAMIGMAKSPSGRVKW